MKLISSFVLAGMIAFGAQAEDFTGTIFIEDVTIAPGETATLSVQIENNIPITGFQLVMELPAGVSVVNWGVSDLRLPSDAEQVKSQSFKEQVFRGALALNSISGEGAIPFTGNSGEVATITIEVDPAAEQGDYFIELTELDVSDTNGMDFDVESSFFTLSIAEPTYPEGYVVDFLPFAVNEEESDVALLLDNLTAITNIAFDLEMPEVLVDVNEDSYYYFIESLLGRNFTVSDEPDARGIVHVSIDRRSRNKIAEGEDTEIVMFGILNEEGTLPEGVYSIKIKNIQMTDEYGETYMIAPYTTEVFVGDAPKATVTDGVAAFHGNYGEPEGFDMLKASLPEGATIDLTEVSALAEDLTELRTDNVIVTADEISYSRAMTTEWGTLCLPFTVESTDGFQLYKLTKVGESEMTFNRIDSAEPNTPLVFKVSGDGFTVTASNDGFVPTFAAENPSIVADAIDNWAWNGSYITETLDVSGMQAYALMDDEFHRITKTLTVKSFRGWLQNNGGPMNAALRISDDTNGIEFVEQEDGSVKLLFDLQGRQLKDGVRSQMFIENGQKKFNR